MATVEHPRIRPGVLEEREYQRTIAERAIDRNTLVVLPTGLGKTSIAIRVLAEYLRRHPQESVLLVAPTRPLVVQHARSIAATVFVAEPIVLTGAITAERRAALLAPPQVVVATPQVIGNDLEAGRFPLDRFSLLVFDEAHRAVGEYPYVAIGKANRDGPKARVLAMTASPGGTLGRIREVWANLGIERFEYRTDDSPDVVPYLHGIGVEPVIVPVPGEVREIANRLRAAVGRQGELLRRLGLVASADPGRRTLLELGTRLHRELRTEVGEEAPHRASLWQAITAQAVAMKGYHALELIESQGAGALREFLARQEPPAGRRWTPAQRTFLRDPDVVEARRRIDNLTVDLPKVATAARLVREELHRRPSSKVIVFSQYRDTVDRLVEELEGAGDPVVRASRFVGQASRGEDPGLSQKDQVGLLDRFRAGEINCLVATSVAEEGLDIPATDLVVFYEPIPDVVRTIQRRGRTGRATAGRVVVLVAEGTRDVGLHRAAGARERRMHELLEQVEAEVERGRPPSPPEARRTQKLLTEYR